MNMKTNHEGCDVDRLRALLEDRVSEAEQAAISEHLEGCDRCRGELERLAAASGFWGDARLLKECEKAEPGPTRLHAVAGGIGPCDEEDEEDVLGFLEPSERGDSLGRIGSYEVLEVVSRGGMGVVYRAHEPTLDRTVAIKVLAPALATSGTARRRFAREAKAAAAVTHEHIVPIHAVDEFRGLPYLVMHYVAGRSLQQRLDASGPLEVAEILRIGMQAASALAAAHAQGVVHRDVKPGNILLENGVERVRLTDFGLARAADDASLTRSGVIAGTPQYMAPEQARGEPVDARADLYALGAVLYAMATGRAPFRADSTMAVLKRVCEDEPRPVREVNSEVPDWLESLINRLMAKRPEDRIGSATEVAQRLEKGLAHLQQPTVFERPEVLRLGESKPAHRSRRRLAVAAAVLVGVLAIGLGAGGAKGLAQVADYVATVLRIKTADGTLVVKVEDPEVKVAVDGEELVISGAGAQEIRLRAGTHRVQAMRDGRAVRDELITITRGGKEVVNVALEPEGAPAGGETARVNRQGFDAIGTERTKMRLANARLHELQGRLSDLKGMYNRAQAELGVAAGPGQKQANPAQIRPWDAVDQLQAMIDELRLQMARIQDGVGRVPSQPQTALEPAQAGRELRVLRGREAWVRALIDDVRLEMARIENGAGRVTSQPQTALEPVQAGRELRVLRGHEGWVRAVAVSPDGRRALSGSEDQTVRLWDLENGEELRKFEGHQAGVSSVAISPDGRLGLSGSFDRTARVWDLETGEELKRFERHGGGVACVAFSPDGRVAATGGGGEYRDGVFLKGPDDNSVRLWDVRTGRELQRFEGHTHWVHGVAFSPDGRRVASCGLDPAIRVWDPETGKEEKCFRAYRAFWSVSFSPDGRLLLSSGDVIQLWDLEAGWDTMMRYGQNGGAWGIGSVVFSPDGRRALSGGNDNVVRLWDVGTGQELAAMSGHTDWVSSVAFTPDGCRAVSASKDGTVRLWALPTVMAPEERQPEPRAEEVQRLHNKIARDVAIRAIMKRRDQNMPIRVQIAPRPDRVRIVHPAASLGNLDAEAWSLAYSPDGKTLVWGGKGVGLMVSEPPGEEPRRIETADNGGFTQMAFLPDGKTLVTSGWDQTVKLWDARSFALKQTLRGHTDAVRSVAVSPDGKRVASGSYDRTARVWDAETGQVALEIPRQELPVNRVEFSPDGKTLLVATGDWKAYWKPGTVSLWDVETGNRTEQLGGHSSQVLGLAVSPDGKTIATAGVDGVLLWTDGPRKRASRLKYEDPSVNFLVFSPDGKTLASAHYQGDVVLWDVESRRRIAVLKGHHGVVFSIAFEPDGKRLATSGIDGMLRLWDVGFLAK